MLTPLLAEPNGPNPMKALRLDSNATLKHHPPESQVAVNTIDNTLRGWGDWGCTLDPRMPEGALRWTRAYDRSDLQQALKERAL